MADPIITSPDQIAFGVVENQHLKFQTISGAKIAPGAIPGSALQQYYSRLRTFHGGEGEGSPIPLSGIAQGDRVVSIVCLDDPAVFPGGMAIGAFEAVVSINGQLRQVSARDLRGYTFLAEFLLPAV